MPDRSAIDWLTACGNRQYIELKSLTFYSSLQANASVFGVDLAQQIRPICDCWIRGPWEATRAWHNLDQDRFGARRSAVPRLASGSEGARSDLSCRARTWFSKSPLNIQGLH